MALHTPDNEKSLLQRLSAGDESAFRAIFDLYKERIFAVAFKIAQDTQVAEEIVQETFMSLWSNRAIVDKVDDPPAYIFTIAYNNIFRELKKTAQRKEVYKKLGQQPDPLNPDDTTAIISFRETDALIQQAIQQLPPQRQLIFKLNREQGLTYEQIAEQLKISPNTVRNQMAEALKQLKLFAKSATISLLLVLIEQIK